MFTDMMAVHVHRLVQGEDVEAVDEKTLIQIAGLLDEREARVWAVLALKNIGPRASFAIPQLEQLVSEADVEERGSLIAPSLSIGDLACQALQSIDGDLDRMPSSCRWRLQDR